MVPKVGVSKVCVMTRPELMTSLAPLVELHQKNVSPTLWDLYFETLKDIPADRFRAVVKQHALTSQWFPKPSELRDLAGVNSGASHEDEAELVWPVVTQAIRSEGYMATVNFGPLVNGVIESMGGWDYLCELSSTELHKWESKTFKKIYAARARADATGPLKLVGHVERENFCYPDFIPNPVDFTGALESAKCPALGSGVKALGNGND